MLKIYTVFFFIYSQNFQSTLIKTLRLHRAGVWGGQARGQTIQRVVIYAVNVDVCSTALLTTNGHGRCFPWIVSNRMFDIIDPYTTCTREHQREVVIAFACYIPGTRNSGLSKAKVEDPSQYSSRGGYFVAPDVVVLLSPIIASCLFCYIRLIGRGIAQIAIQANNSCYFSPPVICRLLLETS